MQQHNCPKQQCMCSEVSELTKLYRDLKCSRRKHCIVDNDSEEKKESSECISAMELQMTRSQAEHVLGIVRTQRDGVGNLMIALREFSQKLSKQEEMLCHTDKEIAELRDEMCRLTEQRQKKQQQQQETSKIDTINAEEIIWRKALNTEISVQCQLKSKIKQLSERLESRKRRERSIDETRQEERKSDAKLLLTAVDCVERCISKTDSLM